MVSSLNFYRSVSRYLKNCFEINVKDNEGIDFLMQVKMHTERTNKIKRERDNIGS